MKIFDFIKSEFENQIIALKNISISDDKKSIVFENEISIESILKLLNILRFYKIAFSFFDNLYPSISDPGAFICYSQELNNTENSWSMTLGNHGWSGGIYTIDDNNISIQIKNLMNQNLLNRISINNVQIFKYDKENIDHNLNLNSLIYGIHSNLDKIYSEYLIFGRYRSDFRGTYSIYKLTDNGLFIDQSESWHSQRHSKDGYICNCEKESNLNTTSEEFELAKNLLYSIPLELISKKWDGFYTTGGKDENKIILAFGNSNFQRTITIDSFIIMSENLPIKIKHYRKEVEKIIELLKI